MSFEFLNFPNTHAAPSTRYRRSMGLPPSQGHNNLRLYHTTNYPHHNHRLYTNKHLYQQHEHQQQQQQHFIQPQQMPQQELPQPHAFKIYHRLDSLRNKFASYPPRARATAVNDTGTAAAPSVSMSSARPADRPNSLFKLRNNHSNRLHKSHSFLNNAVDSSFHYLADTSTSRPLVAAVRRSSAASLVAAKRRYWRASFPMLSHMPLIDRNAELLLVNHSPFALRDPRFGILHHNALSSSYF